MAIFNKLTKISRDMVRGTKDFTDTARLHSLIAEEQKQIAALYAQIGKLFCEASEFDPETPMGKLCLAVEAANQRIANHTDEIRKIKGTRRCAKCGADIPLALFCGVCGAKLENEKPAPIPEAAVFCKGCGAETTGGVAFCASCGQKQ